MEISLDLPDTATLVDLDQAYLKEALVVTLYHVGKLSEKEACLTLGISRRAFEELLPTVRVFCLSGYAGDYRCRTVCMRAPCSRL